jgi:RimJ/RimL family protein N-acetyltransferase
MTTPSEAFTLRPVAEEDLPGIYDIESSDLKCLVGDGRIVSEPFSIWVEEGRRRLVENKTTFSLDSAGAFAGYAVLTSIDLDPRKRELMLLLSTKFVGLRIGSAACRAVCRYAFEQLRAVEVVGVIYTRHTKCIEMVKQLGFTWHGCERKGDRWMERWVLTPEDFEAAAAA